MSSTSTVNTHSNFINTEGTTSTMEISNITVGKRVMRRSHLVESMNDIATSLNSTLSEDIHARSLDLSTNKDTHEIECLKSDITQLKLALKSTQNQLDNIILEKNSLEQKLKQISQDIHILKQISKTPLSSTGRTKLQSSKISVKRRLTDSFKDSKTFQQTNIQTQPNRVESPNRDLPSIQTQNSAVLLPEQETLSAPSEEYKTDLVEHQLEDLTITNISHTVEKQVNTTISRTLPDRSKNKINKELMFCNKLKLSKQHYKARCKRAFIFGGQQYPGLAEHLRKSRQRNPYHQYQFISFVKPYGSTEEILKSAKLYDITEDDRVILCIGQNDSNPFKLQAELCTFIKAINCRILILNVLENNYLNECKLNNMIKMICKQYPNCTFIDNHYNNSSSFNCIFDVCNIINYTLDCLDYSQTYLSLTNMNSRRTSYYPKKNSDAVPGNSRSFRKMITKERSTQTEIQEIQFFRSC